MRQQPCRARLRPYDVRLPIPGTTAGHDIHTVVQPDICVICDPSNIEPSGCLGAPDFVVEVLSPGAMARDWRDKCTLYEEAGVGEYWIVSPQAQFITAFVLDAGTSRYRLLGEYAGPGLVPCATLPGLVLNWSDIFTELS